MRIIDQFDQGVMYYGERDAFLDLASGERLTYRESGRRSHKLACAIRDHGFVKGSKIAILAPNGNDAFVALLGLMRAEGIWLPVNPRNATAVNIDLLSRFDADLLFYHSMYEEEALAIRTAVPSIRVLICLDRAGADAPSLTEWTAGAPDHYAIGREEPDDIFGIFPTGGTTGKSKGVIMTHANVQAMYTNFMTHFQYYDNTRHLVVAPMTHSAGLTGALHFARGGCNVILQKADPEAILRAIESEHITHLFLPPTVLYMLLAREDVRSYDYSSLQHMLVAAAPSALEKLKEAIDVFGTSLTEAFGQAEAPAAVCFKAPWDYRNADGSINESRLHSVGRPAVWNFVAILDDEGNEVQRGSSGEICVKGPLVSPGYYKDPEATAAVRAFGWHHTGDIGVMDEDGYVTIVDRKKDMIISGGFNIYPNMVEQVLMKHPAVQDCAVIGVPDEKWGEAVKAVIQPKPGMEIGSAELTDLVKTELGGVMTPKSVDFISELPRSPAGKVLKTELRKQYWQGFERAVN